MLRKSTVSAPRESKFYQKPISRRFCFFEIKSNWSILNQIMISLFLLTLLTLVFVTSQVILGLYVSKYFFQQFTTDTIQNKTLTALYAEADYQLNRSAQQTISTSFQQQSVENSTIINDVFQLAITLSSNNSQNYLQDGSLLFVGEYSNITNQIVQVNVSDIQQQDAQLLADTEQDFNTNLLYTCYLIGGSFIIILLLGWCFAYYIVRPLKKLAQYAQHINNNTTRLTMGKMSKEKPIELEQIVAQDKIGELINEFKNLIQGLAGLKKGNIQKKTKEIKPFLEGYENQNQEDFRALEKEINLFEDKIYNQ